MRPGLAMACSLAALCLILIVVSRGVAMAAAPDDEKKLVKPEKKDKLRYNDKLRLPHSDKLKFKDTLKLKPEKIELPADFKKGNRLTVPQDKVKHQDPLRTQ